MKRTSLILILAGYIPLSLLSHAQNEDPATESGTSPEATEGQGVSPVADGTPPELSPPPPKLVIAPEDVMDTKTFDLGDNLITTQKITPIELPPIPEPPPPPDPLDPAVQARIQAMRENRQATHFVMIGATVYRSTAFTNGPRTKITSWGGQSREPVVCWSSADWTLLGRTGSVVGESGQKFEFMMAGGSIDLDRWSAFIAQRGTGTYQSPAIPEIPAGEASFVVTEGQLPPKTMEALNALHDLYNDKLATLQANFEAREQERRERDEYLRLNPPQPKNIVIRHWRMDEAGQQGITPKPAVAR